MSIDQTNKEQILNSPAFKKLVIQRWKVSLSLTAIMFFSYIGFLYLLAYNKASLKPYVTGKFTMGLLLALGLIVLAWVLTGIYVYWANNYYNPEVDRIKNKLS
jgi:uncharacterized membrane protein (DUF485 family)